MTDSKCVGCGLVLPYIDGPTHPYMQSSAACWSTYGQVLAQEYSNSGFASVHRYTVDTYAVQHPGRPSHKSSQSVGVHLIALCLLIERKRSVKYATSALGQAADELSFFWLEPPVTEYEMTIADVLPSESATHHIQAVRDWATSTWRRWEQHHEQVRLWADKLDGNDA